MDELLAANPHFLLGKWIGDAKKTAQHPDEEALFEWNARTQVTLWSSPDIPEFHDYANKQWAGLLKDFYAVRWQKFLAEIQNSIQENVEFDEKQFRNEIVLWEKEWGLQKKEYPENANGDTIKYTAKLIEYYGDDFRAKITE